jgi:YD repeat-containing protein
VADPHSAVTAYSYDAVGNLLSLTDSVGNTTAYRYDALHRLVEELDPLGRSTTFAYDAAGNLTSHKDRMGRASEYSDNPGGGSKRDNREFGPKSGTGTPVTCRTRVSPRNGAETTNPATIAQPVAILGIERKKPRRLASAWFVNPRVGTLRNRGYKLRGPDAKL